MYYRENDNLAVGPWLANWAQYVVGHGNPNNRWADNIMEVAEVNLGGKVVAGCGVIGACISVCFPACATTALTRRW